MSPDGVAYLDLAAALRRGDLHHFVQGYWSPLYPALLALIGGVGGASAHAMLPIAHAVNVVAVAGTVFILWRWARAMPSPWFGRAAIAALFLCGTEPPRVEAVTPDLLLMLVLTAIGYELIVRGGRRWLWLGILFGATFLIKTSSWPWLLIALAIRLATAPDRSAWRVAVNSHLVMFGVMLCWMMPMSVQSGGITFGSTGRLNYNWYIETSDSRTPDTHHGTHRQYYPIPVDSNPGFPWARFDQAAQWTYEPWSDPGQWARGVTALAGSQHQRRRA